jgi:uncharacterized protein (UPF0332 family)
MKGTGNIKAQRSFEEATRFMGNAKKELGLAKKNGKYYEDIKHLQMACGTAYLAVLKAVDGIFILREIPRPHKKGRRSIDYYTENMSSIDNKILTSLNNAYSMLHLYGYYDGYNDVKGILSGFEEAESLINKLEQML